MIRTSRLVQAGHCVSANIFDLVCDHYYTDTRAALWGSLGQYETAVNTVFIEPHNRAEGFLHTDSGFTMGAVIYNRVLDIHYGLVAKPITVMLHSQYRGDVGVLREFSKVLKDTVQLLGTQYYEVAQHISGDTQKFRTKRNGWIQQGI